MATHQKQGTEQDPLARESTEQPQEEQSPEATEDTGADYQGAEGTSPKPNYYKEVGLKERQGTTEGQEKFINEPPDANMVDKNRADPHQAEGPGGKGGFGGGGA